MLDHIFSLFSSKEAETLNSSHFLALPNWASTWGAHCATCLPRQGSVNLDAAKGLLHVCSSDSSARTEGFLKPGLSYAWTP